MVLARLREGLRPWEPFVCVRVFVAYESRVGLSVCFLYFKYSVTECSCVGEGMLTRVLRGLSVAHYSAPNDAIPRHLSPVDEARHRMLESMAQCFQGISVLHCELRTYKCKVLFLIRAAPSVYRLALCVY